MIYTKILYQMYISMKIIEKRKAQYIYKTLFQAARAAGDFVISFHIPAVGKGNSSS